MMSTLYNVYQQIHCKPYKKFQLDFLAGVEKNNHKIYTNHKGI